jgi:hypothetical protein
VRPTPHEGDAFIVVGGWAFLEHVVDVAGVGLQVAGEAAEEFFDEVLAVLLAVREQDVVTVDDGRKEVPLLASLSQRAAVWLGLHQS